jgi:endoglucanase
MREPGQKRVILVSSLVALLLGTQPPPAAASQGPNPDQTMRFYVPKPDHGAITQIADLTSSGNKADANLIRAMIETPQAVWFTGGTPKTVSQDVRETVHRAAGKNTVPVLVAYNLPYRDCSQYSAGGAASSQDYKAWIDGFAAGLGDERAVVILEPDGLGIIPFYKQYRHLGTDYLGRNYDDLPYEWCQPPDANPATAADDRFAVLNYAVDALKAHANTRVYLDGTHSGWLPAGDAAHRLAQAGVVRADGFFLNVSNYQPTDHLQKYGTWVAKCIWFGTQGSWGINHFDYCASQYYPASPGDFSTWSLSDDWYTAKVESQSWVPYPGDAGLLHFVIDTSRNGQGPWTPAVAYPDNQDWCNPPARGLGPRPGPDTGVPLNDAFLWVKIPGESDGQCNRGTSGTTDPARGGLADPAAGVWFPDMALELVHNASPPLY